MDDRRRLQIYTLHARGERLVVETWASGDNEGTARLLVDGEVIDEGSGESFDDTDLAEDTPHHTRVTWGWRTGKPTRCLLVEPGSGDVKKRSVPYAPPTGTRAAKIHAWGERHPNLYAARHVVSNLAGTAAALLGLAALLKFIVEPLIPDIDAPDVDLPDAPDLPDWLNYLNPFWYLAKLLNWLGELLEPVFEFIAPLFSWIPEGAVKYVIGFLAAVVYAVREARRRRRIVDAPPPGEDEPIDRAAGPYDQEAEPAAAGPDVGDEQERRGRDPGDARGADEPAPRDDAAV